ncbi:MAG: Ni/Fe-hydrogenase, b-type cytochrome subunit [Vicinamibacterales bacterium]|nr:Ni/Fe-hydrogenase, b-type cytochrome subunit [Vicinamibacterales bacterium]
MAETTYDRVYVWQAPVRMYHWVTASCVFVLIATGLVIGRPPAFMSAGEASDGYWFGWIRFLHFTAAYLMSFALLVRIYWLFAGNQYSRWDAFIPRSLQRLKIQWREAVDVLRVDILQLQKEPIVHVGHNTLAWFSYFFMFLATAFQIVTGAALYAPMSTFWLPGLFSWVSPLMGGDAIVRMWHHAFAWVFIVFTMVHLYLAIFHDMTESRSETSSIITGVRFVERK